LNCIKLPDAEHNVRWNVGAILKNANYSCDIFKQWFNSQKKDKSDRQLTYEWNCFKQYKYSMGTLIWMAKQNNLDKFNEWQEKYLRLKALKHLSYHLDDHGNTSDYFYNHNKDLCHYEDKT
jgi:hypothetical protein